jgi:hypothetical protein
MMQKLAYKARLTYIPSARLLTGAAAPCLPTIPAEGIPNLTGVEHYLRVCQTTPPWSSISPPLLPLL